MMTCTSHRSIFILLLILSLLPTAGAWAVGVRAGRDERSAVTNPAGVTLLSRAWSLLTALWDKEGCHIDPNGRCVTGPDTSPVVPRQADTGCGIDPNGR